MLVKQPNYVQLTLCNRQHQMNEAHNGKIEVKVCAGELCNALEEEGTVD